MLLYQCISLLLGKTIREKWWVRDPFDLSLRSFNNLNSYNSTKTSLLNAQTHLRDPCIATCKGRQVGPNLGGEKGEKLRRATQTQPWSRELTVGRGKESGFGWYSLQLRGVRRSSEHSYRKGQYKLWLSSVTWAGTKHRCVALGVWHLTFKIQKQSHRAWLPLNLPKHASLHPWCPVAEHIIWNPRTGTTESPFPWAKGGLC